MKSLLYICSLAAGSVTVVPAYNGEHEAKDVLANLVPKTQLIDMSA